MSGGRRALSAVLALLLLALASVPCPEGGRAAGRVVTAEHAVEAGGVITAATTATTPSPPPAAVPALSPHCPCGCDHGPATSAPATRLPAALLAAAPERMPIAARPWPAAAIPRPLARAGAAIDHVPLRSA